MWAALAGGGCHVPLGICPIFGLIHPQLPLQLLSASKMGQNGAVCVPGVLWLAASPHTGLAEVRVSLSPAWAGGHTGTVPAVPPVAPQHFPLPALGEVGIAQLCPAQSSARVHTQAQGSAAPTPALSPLGLPDQLGGTGSPPTFPISDPPRCSLSLCPLGRNGAKQSAP